MATAASVCTAIATTRHSRRQFTDRQHTVPRPLKLPRKLQDESRLVKSEHLVMTQ
eukprot:COSAG03_NODE_19866_length_328_cov_1.244541_1_plen_54_part_01